MTELRNVPFEEGMHVSVELSDDVHPGGRPVQTKLRLPDPGVTLVASWKLCPTVGTPEETVGAVTVGRS